MQLTKYTPVLELENARILGKDFQNVTQEQMCIRDSVMATI